MLRFLRTNACALAGLSKHLKFIMPAGLWLQAKKEGNAEIAAKLEETLRVAMAELQKHLRPEIRLLNELMQIQDDGERLKVGSPLKLSCLAWIATSGCPFFL